MQLNMISLISGIVCLPVVHALLCVLEFLFVVISIIVEGYLPLFSPSCPLHLALSIYIVCHSQLCCVCLLMHEFCLQLSVSDQWQLTYGSLPPLSYPLYLHHMPFMIMLHPYSCVFHLVCFDFVHLHTIHLWHCGCPSITIVIASHIIFDSPSSFVFIL